MRQLIVAQLFERNRSRLQLNWICGTLNRAITITRDDISPADLVGHLNLIHPDRLQILGSPEISWAARQTPERVANHMREVIAAKPPALMRSSACSRALPIRMKHR